MTSALRTTLVRMSAVAVDKPYKKLVQAVFAKVVVVQLQQGFAGFLAQPQRRAFDQRVAPLNLA